MFNLPWYAWLNVFALPCLWLYLMLECAFQSRPTWFRQYTSVSIIACACSVFLYWNPAANALFTPLQYGLIALIVPLTTVSVGIIVLQLLSSILEWLTGDSEQREQSLSTTQEGVAFNLDDDDIDLDGGTRRTIGHEQRGAVIAALLSSQSTLDDSVGNIMTLLGTQEDDSTTLTLVGMLSIQLICTGLIMMPPLLMSFRLI